MSPDPVIQFTDQNFQVEVISSPSLVMVVFWASWSESSRLLNPIVDQLASDYAGRIVMGRLNVDEGQQTARQLGVIRLPTIVFFRNGRDVDRLLGPFSRASLESRIDVLLNNSE